MKKLISILLLLEVIVMVSSCSKNETNYLNPDSKEVRINLNVYNNIKITQVNSNASLTRAESSPASFVPIFPTTFKAYFISAENTGVYSRGAIVKIVDVNMGNNSVTVPDIKYDVYVTNFNINLSSDKSKDQESILKDMQSSFPESTTSIYLYGNENEVIFHQNQNTTVTMVNPYAAVCVLHNNFVTNVQYNVSSSSPLATSTYKDSGKGNWFYLYLKSTNTNSTIYLQNIPYNTGSYKLMKDIEPNNVYEYIVSDDKSNNKFVVSVIDWTYNTPETITTE
jgi:hypothetical protein